ncbi:MAG TPA: histidine phosphotransferase family protein [Stellaceae bacterium]|nr:histidine phosphotransferase family protein [Stellaceae bacterium]
MDVDLRVVELLSARLCHDLVGPVAAVSNGVELMSDDDPDFARDAVALVSDAAAKASSRLQFYRFAFGYRDGASSGQPPHALVEALFDGGNVIVEYGEPVRQLDLAWQKLACNMLLVAGEALPRGGRLLLKAGAAGPDLEAIGEGTGPTPEIRDALRLTASVGELTPRTVAAYFAAQLAAALGRRIEFIGAPGSFQLRAVQV